MAVTGPDYPRATIPHVRVVAGGTLGDGQQEIWSCTLKVTSFTVPVSPADQLFNAILGHDTDNAAAIDALMTGPQGNDGLQAYADGAAVPAWQALFAAVCSNHAALTYVKVNAFGADDKQANGTTVDRQFTPIGGQAGGGAPFTIGQVIELRTSHKSRGTGTHGRITLPSSPVIDGSGQAQFTINQTPLGIDTHFATFLSTLNGNSTAGRQLLPAIIYTQEVGRPYKNTTTDRTPVANAVDTFLVSSLPGIVRRRGNKLKQMSSIKPVTYGGTNG